jgi:hypothetical protein
VESKTRYILAVTQPLGDVASMAIIRIIEIAAGRQRRPDATRCAMGLKLA